MKASIARTEKKLVFVCTHIAEKVDEWVVAAVGHGQPVTTEPDNVDVLVTENIK